MSTFFKKFKTYVKAHKIVSAIVIILLAGGGYYAYQASNTPATVTKYVVQDATLGSVIASVSGTGQVQAGTTIDVAAKVSETVTGIPVKVGDHVSAGQVLVQLDPTNERQAVNQAQLSLESAQLALQELQQVTTSTLLQDQDAVQTDEINATNASTSLVQDYQSGFDTISSAFTDFQTVMAGLQSFSQGNDLSKSQNDPNAYANLMPSYDQSTVAGYVDSFQSQYSAAVTAYQQNLADYHAANRNSSPQALDALFAETYNTAKTISDTVKAGKDFLTYVVNNYPGTGTAAPLPAITTTFQNDFNTYTTTIGGDVTNVSGAQTTITNDENSIVSTQASLAAASETLSELNAGPTATQLLAAQINVQSAQNSLTTAQQNLDYTSVTAPISGTVSAITATIGEAPGSNPVTLVGDGEVAEVTLNEIDAAKVMVGDKATLTFDALPDLSLAGTVVELDPVGTVSQGVVNYNAQIGFTQPTNTSSSMVVKPGMSVTANIVTQADQNVIAVPNSALVTSGGASYILEPATPLSASELASSANGGVAIPATKNVPVVTGLSNSTMTEVTSGISVGDQIITQTIKSAAVSTAATVSGGTNALQLLGGAGGGVRVGGGAGGGGFTRGG